MKDIIELCEVQIEGNITGSIEDVIEFFKDLRHSYHTLLENIIFSDAETRERIYLAEPDDSLIKDEIDFSIFSEDKRVDEYVNALAEKKSSLANNHPLMITKLNFNSPGFMELGGALLALKLIVEFIEKRRREAIEVKKIKAETNYIDAKTEDIKSKTRNDKLDTILALSNEKISPLYSQVANLLSEELKSNLLNKPLINCIATAFESINKQIENGHITTAKIIKRGGKNKE